MCNAKLVVQNLNVQSDASDLFGGFKPLQIRQLALPLYVDFVGMFKSLFNESQNAAFLEGLARAFDGQNWKSFSHGLDKAVAEAAAKLVREGSRWPAGTRTAWAELRKRLDSFEKQRKVAAEAFAFSFVEGLLVQVGNAVLVDVAAAATLVITLGVSWGSLCWF